MKIVSALALFATAAFPSVFAAMLSVYVGLPSNTFPVCITAFLICFVLITPVIAGEYDDGGRRRRHVLVLSRNHVCVPYLIFSWHPHKVNFTHRPLLRLLFPNLAPKPDSTTVMFLVSTPVCEWLFVYTPIGPSLMGLQRFR